MNTKGFYMYLWLALFTVFVSFFGIILFNYVSTDIRVTRSLYTDSRTYYHIKSILMAVTELYREQNFNNPTNQNIRTGVFSSPNYSFGSTYTVTPLNQTHLLIQLLRDGNVWARGIVKWRENIGDFAFITAKNNEQFKNNSFYSSAAIFSNTIYIPNSKRFIFNKVLINENVIINGKGPFNNLIEMQKFSQFIEVNNSINAIIEYYRQLRDESRNKLVDPITSNPSYSSTYSNAGDIVLTPYGGIWIKSSVPSLRVNFRIQNGNQIIEFRRIDNGNLVAIFTHVIQNPITINLNDGDKVISNDANIVDAANRYNTNITIPPYAKVLIYYPNIKTIYTNSSPSDLNTIIYTESPMIIGSDEPNNTNNATINSKIMIISIAPITIQNNILYSNFSNITDYINKIEAQDELILPNDTNNNGLLRVLAPIITIDTSQFDKTNPSKKNVCLNGQFVTMYDPNSKVIISNPENIEAIYLFGSLQFSQRENFNADFKEKYLLDSRLSALDPSLSTIIDKIDDNIYINTNIVLGIEIINK